jgi:hypothetical protein
MSILNGENRAVCIFSALIHGAAENKAPQSRKIHIPPGLREIFADAARHRHCAILQAPMGFVDDCKVIKAQAVSAMPLQSTTHTILSHNS